MQLAGALVLHQCLSMARVHGIQQGVTLHHLATMHGPVLQMHMMYYRRMTATQSWAHGKLQELAPTTICRLVHLMSLLHPV